MLRPLTRLSRASGVANTAWPSDPAALRPVRSRTRGGREERARRRRHDRLPAPALGLIKKFAADNLTAWIDFHDDRYETLPMRLRWLIFGGIAMRIVLDFSGYSDIAIGFARRWACGCRRTSGSRTWRAARRTSGWHISLSSWIRDYIYIPLGGNRMGPVRKVTNGILAFTLCGLWHGASGVLDTLVGMRRRGKLCCGIKALEPTAISGTSFATSMSPAENATS